MTAPEECTQCGAAIYHGFARCKNPDCRAIRNPLLKYKDAVVETEGTCVFSGAPTDVRLPIGHYISADTLLDCIDRGFISEDLVYTDRFLEMYPRMKDFDPDADERG